MAVSDSTYSRNFNPRSPCGERLGQHVQASYPKDISIHALLAESDLLLDLIAVQQIKISIHALLAESDSKYHQIGPIVSV